MIAVRKQLQTRLMRVFAGYTLAVTLVFGGYAWIFMYSVEDDVFRGQLKIEAAKQKAIYKNTQSWVDPNNTNMQVVIGHAALPDDIGMQLAEEPDRIEFSGKQGRHYHLYALTSDSIVPVWLVYEVSTQLVIRPIRTHLLLLFISTGFFVIVCALLVGRQLARRTSIPLAKLADAVAGIRPDAMPEKLPDAPHNDEVAAITRGLDRLLERIHDFVMRERAFTRDASHELRTPLAVIRMSCEYLEGRRDFDTDAAERIRFILQSTSALEQTVEALLELARESEASTLGGGAPAFTLPLLERVIVAQSPLIGERPITVQLNVHEQHCLPLPSTVLHIMLSNLVGNAFAHGSDGEVRITAEANRIWLHNAAKIQAEVPLELSNSREGAIGYGFGLGIVRRLCERYGAELHILQHEGSFEIGIEMPDQNTSKSN